MGNDLDVRVFGNVEIRRAGVPLSIGGPKPRLLLSLLVAAHGDVVSTDRLCEELWGDDQPGDPGAVLQGNISRLRRLLAPEMRIITRPPGYALESDDAVVDAWRFLDEHEAALRATEPAVAIDHYRVALQGCGGAPFAEFADRDGLRATVARLEEARLAATENWLSLRLELGEDHALVADLESLVADHPYRERPWMLLAKALHRTGRSADALRRIRTLRAILRDELGLDLPQGIRDLELRVLESDPALLAPQAAPSGRALRLPPGEMTPLVGRALDVAGVVAGLGERRLITLVGPGGVGKTRVALRVAADLWNARGGEVYVVELAPVQDLLSTVASVATAVDVQQRQHRSVEESLIEFLHGRRALLVLDNCEHLRVAVARLAERLLLACPDLTILATSREVLGLPVEHVRRVQPLANAAAMRLFVERAAVSRPGFALGPDNEASVAEIVRRVDGLPLAIELAAARVRALSPAALAERLQQRFDLLDNAQHAAAERHSTVTELVGWSFNLLTNEEQLLFSRLAVFAGGFGLDAAEAVCADSSLDSTVVARLLVALVDKSMVQMVDIEGDRYRLLEPLREFGRSRLSADAAAAVSRRHAQWCVQLAERAGTALAGPNEAAAAAALDRDFDNLRAAFSWMIEHNDIDWGSRLVVSLREYSFRSMRAEVIAWADDVIALPGFELAARAPVVLGVAAYGRFVRGDLDSSIEYGNLAIAASDRLEAGTSGVAERALGNSWFYKGDAATAQTWIDRMLVDAEHGSSSRRAHAMYMRSVAFTSVGDPQRGAELAREAMVEARRSGSPTALAQASYALGLALETSDEAAASGLLIQAAQVAAAAGNRWVQAFAQTEVLWLEARRGLPRTALAGFADVIELWFRGGDWANQWLSLRHLFGILVQLEDHRAAATLHGALTAVGAAFALPFVVTDAAHLDALIAGLRESLGGPAFAAAVRHGASMTDGEIVELAQERIRVLTAQ